MKPHQQLRRVKTSERCYHWLIWFYPAPFRAAFGQSMRQVFRDQCIDTIERKGGWGLAVLWLRTLLDFAWTCPKEHIIALPTLPRRIWEQSARKPVWHYPALLAIICFLVALVIAFQSPQYHWSSATLLVRVLMSANGSTPIDLTDSKQAESLSLGFELPDSAAVMYPVIERLGLQSVYQDRLGLPASPTMEEAHKFLIDRVKFRNASSTVLQITVHDEDKHRAKTIAEALVDQCQKHMTASKASDPTAPANQVQVRPYITLLKTPEESARLVRPQFRASVLLGGKISLAFGGLAFAAVLLQRWRNRRSMRFAPN